MKILSALFVILFIAGLFAINNCSTSVVNEKEYTAVPDISESISPSVPLVLSAYPIDYDAKISGYKIWLRKAGADSTAEIHKIILRRLFVYKEYCIMPKEELPGEWQKFTVTHPMFWNDIYKPMSDL